MLLRSLQYRIAIVFIGLLILVMGFILTLVTRSNSAIVATEMARELRAGSHVFANLVEQSQTQLETAAGVLSADFAFREAIATQDQATMRSVIRNHGLRIGAQVMMVIHPDGQLIADTQQANGIVQDFPFGDLLTHAETQGKASGFKQMANGRLYQIVVVPILAPNRIAWVAMGFLVDDNWARNLSRMTALEVSVLGQKSAKSSILASSFAMAERDALALALGQTAMAVPTALTIRTEHYQSVRLPLGPQASVILQRSIEQAEAPFRSLQTTLWLIIVVGIVLFALGSLMLARRIVRPVNQLASAAQRIEAGNYLEALPDFAQDEIGRLARSFDRMREQVASREQKILKLAYQDSLTGLPNRTRFLEGYAQLAEANQGAVAVLNLDRFALINNALGHAIGDRLLQEIAVRFEQLLGSGDLVARLWGDEFVFLLPRRDQAAAMQFAEVALAKMRETITLDRQRLDVGGTLGIALYPADGDDVGTLLRRAEFAMYAAKRKHNGIAFVSEVGDAPQHEQLSLIGEMRDALGQDEFVVYYQPKLDLRSRRITGAEALIRWQHPVRGLVPPIQFIPFAEQTGFIREITPWLLQKVVTQTAQWRQQGIDIVPSINLSALDLLDPQLVERVAHLIGAHKLGPHSVCLEITESALMEDPELALRHLDQLAALGLKLSIDDYGVGQASLAYLRTLPVHELKIDQTFVRAVGSAPKNAAIVHSTIVLGHALGLSIVAEGAETDADLAWLGAHDCDLAQGYGIARPMPAAAFATWLAGYKTPIEKLKNLPLAV